MSYSARCMNVQPADPGFEGNPHIAYKLGHRDARHAAAEIAAEADATIAELVAALAMVDAHYSASLDYQPAYVHAARAALARVKGQA